MESLLPKPPETPAFFIALDASEAEPTLPHPPMTETPVSQYDVLEAIVANYSASQTPLTPHPLI